MANFFATERRASKTASGTWRSLFFDFEAAEAEIRRRRQVLDLDCVQDSILDDRVSEELRSKLIEMLTFEEHDPDEPMSRLRERRDLPDPAGLEGGPASAEPSRGPPARLSVSGQPLVIGGYEGMRSSAKISACWHWSSDDKLRMPSRLALRSNLSPSRLALRSNLSPSRLVVSFLCGQKSSMIAFFSLLVPLASALILPAT